MSCEISRFSRSWKKSWDTQVDGYKVKSVTFGLHIASYRTNNHIKKIVRKKITYIYTVFTCASQIGEVYLEKKNFLIRN
jgi:hypothetical protein